MVLSRDDAKDPRGERWAPVAAGLALHEDELDVVLDDRVGLVGLPKEATTVIHLVDRVRDLVPDDRGEVVEAQPSAVLLNRGVERDDHVPATVLSAREAHVPDDADQTAAGHEGSVAVLPHAIQFGEELLVVGYVAKLVLAPPVLLERPVRRRCEDEVDTLVGHGCHVPGVPEVEVVGRWDALHRLLDQAREPWVPSDSGQCLLMVAELADLGRKVIAELRVRSDEHVACILEGRVQGQGRVRAGTYHRRGSVRTPQAVVSPRLPASIGKCRQPSSGRACEALLQARTFFVGRWLEPALQAVSAGLTRSSDCIRPRSWMPRSLRTFREDAWGSLGAS